MLNLLNYLHIKGINEVISDWIILSQCFSEAILVFTIYASYCIIVKPSEKYSGHEWWEVFDLCYLLIILFFEILLGYIEVRTFVRYMKFPHSIIITNDSFWIKLCLQFLPSTFRIILHDPSSWSIFLFSHPDDRSWRMIWNVDGKNCRHSSIQKLSLLRPLVLKV